MSKNIITTGTIVVLMAGVLGLAALYVFQRFNYGLILLTTIGVFEPSENLIFILNKTIRLVANDIICMTMIFSIFKEKAYRQLTAVVFLVEVALVLPIYLLLKLKIEGTSEISTPLLSFIHRLVINPTLMILTGIALAYQKFVYRTAPKT